MGVTFVNMTNLSTGDATLECTSMEMPTTPSPRALWDAVKATVSKQHCVEANGVFKRLGTTQSIDAREYKLSFDIALQLDNSDLLHELNTTEDIADSMSIKGS